MDSIARTFAIVSVPLESQQAFDDHGPLHFILPEDVFANLPIIPFGWAGNSDEYLVMKLSS